MPHVLFVHGLWMPGAESLSLLRRLEQDFRFAPRIFLYSPVVERIDTVVDRLDAEVRKLARQGDDVHLIGHSLGGLVVLRLFERYPEQPPGRVMLLGSPVCGSRAARAFDHLPLAHRLIGERTAGTLLEDAQRCWRAPRELGVIAGTQPIGLGRLLANFDEPNDGTVALRETELEGCSERLVLPVSHFGMLFSPHVARCVGEFLGTGRFPPDAEVKPDAAAQPDPGR